MSKKRVDLLLIEKGLVDSRAKAQRLVMAGQVRVGGQVVPKPSTKVPDDAEVVILEGPRYVSRGGEKLAAALDGFAFPVAGFTCADVGASTGGFTDCLLQNGAAFVYAIDVGKGILDWRLRNNARIRVMEGVNARFLDALPEPVDLVTVDASFISLNLLLPVFKPWFAPDRGDVIALIKPQFEAGREQVKRGKGVIRDPEIHHQVLVNVLDNAQAEGYACQGLMRSPLLGPKGNMEFLAWLRLHSQPAFEIETHLQKLIFGSSD